MVIATPGRSRNCREMLWMMVSASVIAKTPFWMQLTWNISPKLGPTSARRPKSIAAKAARRAAAEVTAGDKDFGIAIGRIVQDEIGARASTFVETKIVEEGLAIVVSGLPVTAHVTPRQDHAGVDFSNLQRS